MDPGEVKVFTCALPQFGNVIYLRTPAKTKPFAKICVVDDEIFVNICVANGEIFVKICVVNGGIFVKIYVNLPLN